MTSQTKFLLGIYLELIKMLIEKSNMKTVLVTGSAGFIGFHVCNKFLGEGWRVIGVDCLTDYYDKTLKEDRESLLLASKNYISVHAKIETTGVLKSIFQKEKPQVVIHLAAQAGVRYSVEFPRKYLESNIIGTFELLEAARAHKPKHLLLASTSSVYGANDEMPFKETDKADSQLSFYAATKKSSENMSYYYSHMFDLPVTIFRFFTVYGPWGRPDMALFKFTKAILNNDPIEVYNFGEMKRDFTYIDDLVHSIRLLVDQVPPSEENTNPTSSISLSAAQYRVVNIGNSQPIKLSKFIQAIELALGSKAKKNFLPLQDGDVPETWADNQVLKTLTNYIPETDIRTGVQQFVNWYKEYYQI